LVFLRPDGYPLSVVVPILGGTIEESILAVANNQTDAGTKGKFSEADVRSSPVAQSLTKCVNLLLYLCSEKPDMPNDASLQTRRSKDSYGTPKRAVTWDVGTRIGAALRKAIQTDSRNETARNETAANISPRSAPRPHMRSAHWHSFWTGGRNSSERKLVLRWLPPIAVNIEGEDMPSVLRPVKDNKEIVSKDRP